jgi:hypothetical protein
MVTRKRFDPRSALPGSPFLTHVVLREDRVQPGVHPFTVPWLLPSLDLQLSAPVTFLVGFTAYREVGSTDRIPGLRVDGPNVNTLTIGIFYRF